MMQILSDQYKIDIGELDKEILKWQDDHNHLVPHNCFLAKDKALKEHFTKYATGLIKTKENKFMRDKKAYDQDQAYKWNQQGHHSRRRGTHNHAPPVSNLDLVESVTTSMSSASYVPIATQFNEPNGASRKRKKDSETGSQGRSRSTHAHNKDKRTWSQRSQSHWHHPEYPDDW